ncbi:MAG: hypothetical protein K0R85_381 [Devosia sp.]|jgi:3-oxoacyl-[acyl-carrier protein] reductase|nr:hypothetical protein [Devosia sp.]
MASLAGQTALVIGGAIGIGRAVAEALSRAGARVLVADRALAEERRALMLELAGDGGIADHCECDVTRREDVVAAVARGIELGEGQLHILVNNAGIGLPMTDFIDISWPDWQRVMDVNLRGTAYGIQAVLPHMLDRGYGRIVNTASQLAHKPAAQAAAYSASKAGIVALTTAVAVEVASRGVLVNCVCPGPTDTATWRKSEPEWARNKAASLPIGRIAHPDEIAGAYVFLASEAGNFMVGQSISPNGGDVSW